MRRDKLAEAVRRSARRGEARHHRLDDELASMKETRAELVATFNSRLNQIETNTARIEANIARIEQLTNDLAAHIADKKAHK